MVKKILKISYIVLALAFIYAPIVLLTIYSFNLSPSIGICSPTSSPALRASSS